MSVVSPTTFLDCASFAEILLQSEIGVDVIRSEAAAAWPRAGPLGPTPIEAQWAQFSFENLPICDVLARTEFGISQLDAVADVLRLSANAEEAYSRALLETAHAGAPSRVRGSGQGIGPAVDGGVRSSVVGAVAAAGLSALGGLFGASTTTTTTDATRAASPVTAADATSALATLGNGPGSLGAALETMARGHAKLSAQRGALGAHLRRVGAGVLALRAGQRSASDAATARINEAVRATAAVARDLERAQGRIEPQRRVLADAEARFRSAAENPGAVSELETGRRQALLLKAKLDLEVAEGTVMSASESLVASRRRRGDELSSAACTLQRLEDERAAAVARVLADVAGSSLESASALKTVSSGIADAVTAIASESDTRTFMHQRRIALMLAEQTAMQDRRGGGAQGREDDLATVPQPLPRLIAARHSRDFLATERDLAPRVQAWAEAIYLGTGRDTLNGVTLPEAPMLDAIIAVDDDDDDEGDSKTTSKANSAKATTTADEDQVVYYEVTWFAHQAARMAFLRALNLQRSRAQDVGASFPRLARALWWLLDASAAANDVAAARMAMVMAETFFYVPNKSSTSLPVITPTNNHAADASDDESSQRPQRIFLQNFIRGHRVWRVEAFWEEVFYASVFEAVRTASNPHAEHNGDGASSTSSGGGGDGSASPRSNGLSSPTAVGAPLPAYRPGSQDWCYAYEQTVFSNLLAVAMNMTTFGE